MEDFEKEFEQELKAFRAEFAQWLLKKGVPDAKWHVSNAEVFYDYSVTYLNKIPPEITIEDLKFFMYSWYIRKVTTFAKDFKYLLPKSIEHCYEFLDEENTIKDLDKFLQVCRDENSFRYRLNTYLSLNHDDEDAWEEGFSKWCEELTTSEWIGTEFFEEEIWNDLESFFYQATKGKSRNTANKYRYAIDLFATFLEQEEIAPYFDYEIFEMFLAWWYLRKYSNPSVNGANNIISVFNKFAQYMVDKGSMSTEEWPKRKVRQLKKDMQRVLSWAKDAQKGNFKLKSKELNDSNYNPVDTEYFYFQVKDVNPRGVKVRDLEEGTNFRMVLRGQIKKYIKPGDYICGFPAVRGKKTVLRDEDIVNLYPAQAQLTVTVTYNS